MKCSKCHTDNPDTSRFCGSCAAPLASERQPPDSFTKTLSTPARTLAKDSLVAGRYRIVEEIGRGGMGIVYKAVDMRLKRPVALKFLPPGLALDNAIRERFLREAQAAAALSHPNICTIYEVDDQAEQAFISMEYIEGRSLREKAAYGPLPFEDVLDIALQVCAGLDEAHKKGIVHRDIKSANIMLTAKGQAKIMDFGLAKVAGTAMLTKEGSTMGTVAYMSPEQARGEAVDTRTDIWSLGVVLYEIASGKLPFKGDLESAIIHNIVHEEPKPLKAIVPKVPEEFERIVRRALKKKVDDRCGSSAEMMADLKKLSTDIEKEKAGVFNIRSFFRLIQKPLVAIPAALVLIALGFVIYSIINRQAKVRWARTVVLSQIEGLAPDIALSVDAFEMAQQIKEIIPKDPKLRALFEKIAVNIDIHSTPPGAAVSVKPYQHLDKDWQPLGLTPIKGRQVPRGFFVWKFEKEGYETAIEVLPSWAWDVKSSITVVQLPVSCVLDKSGSIPPDMVRVPGGELGDFIVDRYETTNQRYKEFVDAGGYEKPEYWRHPFVKDGRALPWKAAMPEFVDQTGRPGPATWSAGDFPDGQGDFPVSGISWYEAAAFAAYANKDLPTTLHWAIAAGLIPVNPPPKLSVSSLPLSLLVPLSNIGEGGPVRVGSRLNIPRFEIFDLAGNVREWCWNEGPYGRCLRGGSWKDPTYMFSAFAQAPAFDRSDRNGFRCIRYLDRGRVPQVAFAPLALKPPRDYHRALKEEAVSPDIFKVFHRQFAYDPLPLNVETESPDESAPAWTKQKVMFNAAYGNDRMAGYLLLPKKGVPPFQTVVYWPGSGAVWATSSVNIERDWDVYVEFLPKNGRAVFLPIYNGTYERRGDIPELLHAGNNTRQYLDYLIQVVKDFRRSIDYLETRPEIDKDRIAFYGFSWGGELGSLVPAVESRLKASVLVSGGLPGYAPDYPDYDPARLPEADEINYIGHVTIPTLMLNGRYDINGFDFETSVKPMFELLGTPLEQKKLIGYDSDHFVPQNAVVKETLAWLDKYLGPVKK